MKNNVHHEKHHVIIQKYGKRYLSVKRILIDVRVKTEELTMLLPLF